MNQSSYSNNKVSNKRGLVFFTLVFLIIFLAGLISGSVLQTLIKQGNTVSSASNSPVNYYDQIYLNNLYQIVQEKFIGDMPTKEKITQSLSKGLISSLNSEYSSFLNPDEAKNYLDSRDPNFEGIGVTLKYENDYTKVETVLKDYPADKSGILSGDIILEVDGVSMKSKQPSDVANKVKGSAGTDVKLKVARLDQSTAEYTQKEFTITRQKIELSNISYQFLENSKDYVKISISQFIDKSPEVFNQKWDDTVNKILGENKNLKGIIIDLRNNPGGYVYSVRYLLEDFLPKGQILMSEQRKGESPVSYRSTREGRFLNIPMTVLLNEGSASASEIFSGAIQDTNRGKVIGKKSVGKGVEQEVSKLDDGSLLILVFQKWLTPNGKNIDKQNPITPDIEVDLNVDEYKKGNDTQLDKALEVLQKISN